MSGAGKEQNSYIACLTNRDFLLFYSGQYISFIGDRLAQLAFIAVLMGTIAAGEAATGASSKVTLLMLVSMTPYLFMFPISGFLIDRFRRRNVMIVCTCLQGIITIGAAEILRAQGFQGVSHAVIYISILLIYTNSAVFNPAKYALIPEIVETKHLLAANALNTSTATISTLIGTFLGGMLIESLYQRTGSETSGIVWSLYLDTLTFFIPGLLLLFVKGDRKGPKERDIAGPSVWAQLAEGFHYIWTHWVVLRLMGLVGIIWFIAGFFNAALNQLTIDQMGAGIQTYSIVYGTIGLGMFSGAILTGLTCRRIRPRKVLAWALLTTAILLLATRITLQIQGVRLVALFVTAGAAGGVIVTLDTLYQRIIPNGVRGRIFSINFLVSTSSLIAGMGAQLLIDTQQVGRRLSEALPAVFAEESVYFELLSLVAFAGFFTVLALSRAPISHRLKRQSSEKASH
ncbi:MFS transporter [Candidatus Sumerlaeota bacterium]|nr:MFS transporter [Candidatus Sumerlaeota bacterium]